jgi:hypothetical protein
LNFKDKKISKVQKSRCDFDLKPTKIVPRTSDYSTTDEEGGSYTTTKACDPLENIGDSPFVKRNRIYSVDVQSFEQTSPNAVRRVNLDASEENAVIRPWPC